LKLYVQVNVRSRLKFGVVGVLLLVYKLLDECECIVVVFGGDDTGVDVDCKKFGVVDDDDGLS
jgi:hypothetical protein